MKSLRDSLAGLRAGLYARKSAYQGKTKNKGRSVKEQLDYGHATADELGVNVVGEFVDDDRSASRYRGREREELERMIEAIEQGKLDIVIAWGSTRLQRDVAIYARLRDACAAHGVLWCYGGKVYDLTNKDDRFRTGLDALLGEREVDELRDNIMRTLRANALDGKPHGQPSYGYRRVYDERTGAYVCTEADAVEALVVDEIVTGVGDGRESTKIARALNLRGVTPPTPYWSKGQVKRLAEWRPGLKENEEIHPDWLARIVAAVELRQEARERLDAGESAVKVAEDFNERQVPLIMARWISATVTAYATDVRYIGVRTHRGKVTAEGAWPALVSKAKHERAVTAVAARKEKRKFNQRPGRAIHWLSGIMICDICEIRVNSDRQHGKPRYSCAAPAAGASKGYHASAQIEVVDPFVRRKLFRWLSSKSFAKAYAKGDEELLREIEEARAEAKLLRDELEEFYDEAAAGKLSARALSAIEAKKLPRIVEAEQRAEVLGVPKVVRKLVGLDEAALTTAWGALELSQQRLIVEALLEVRLKPQGPGRWKRGVPVEQFVAVVPRQLTRKPAAKAA
ncbi:recombinase family protein [Streptomyces sp. Da 82-17]|uniref:recombinase family protein n=1 Tax=Streptomyces sp. Da 82-17 TaxID=3377116 RepID=UPI0038D516A3